MGVPLLYGIKTCGSVKKAIKLLDSHQIAYDFIDLKIHTPSLKDIEIWATQKGIQTILNTKGMTYKNLKKDNQLPQNDTLEENIALLHRVPMLLKRPIISYKEMLVVGFDEDALMNFVQYVKGNQ
ncbi:Spx/MgsR family RNA polymerase-binding regulatory protein [Helicobacter sp. MIT 05-5293]|uniref:Spx/MgsR family RNA polymerase-binding regulatory protein n=1 Tax=Helicobacter sp. MIT 05-5293 TaxID=1548149 RepID=UPI00051DBF93|nr:Spx/MgsR family RNA polymerase-binding regulatory protein [Helicobacter sp. MIT 05-5293]TLD82226.1 Spx/MgsR family RNA polymerase-binding regulatory protein [Helicobacter sp. MIT 05-5293]